MDNHKIVFSKNESQPHLTVMRVQDSTFNVSTLLQDQQWLWVFEDSYEFFPFEYWEELNSAVVGQIFVIDEESFVVIYIFKIPSRLCS